VIYYLTGERASDGNIPSTRWRHGEFRSFSFVDGDEDNASIIETQESKERRKGTERLVDGTKMKRFEVMRN